MSDIKDINSFLDHLSGVFPQGSYEINPWSWLAAITFSVLNRQEVVPVIFQYALNKLSTHEDKLLLARKFRESILSSVVSGIPQVINSLSLLNDVMPEELKEKSTLRRNDIPLSELLQIGRTYFNRMYGSTAESISGKLRNAYPDLETIIYGYYANIPINIPILNMNETSYALIASLTAIQVPLQVGWHLNNALRNGAPTEEVKAAREIALKVAEFCSVDRTIGLPDVNVPDK
ncbi:hypothetical protein Clacol_002099 [Clathrus columnatus]|uniref:Carboxymuconolactone decarboxylase-like domain-containing protein n=1 Tax=Clathrus columnatus TaxID=1419009 RepID=A0AAV5A331_9AGAM|nr:hypothetical protein Clacol_002099 [Clathrus columnatus]